MSLLRERLCGNAGNLSDRPQHFFPMLQRLGLALVLFILSANLWAAQPPEIVVSSRPVHSLVSGLMQGIGEPTLLIEQPISPWEHTADIDDIELVSTADLLIWTGSELEPSVAELLAQIDSRPQLFEVLSSDALKILPARQDDRLRDPFFWLDSRNMLILLDEFAQWLINADPERSDIYQRNRNQMAATLSELDREMEFRYRDVSGVPVFFYHDTHQYFEQAYAMHVGGSVAAFGESSADNAERLLALRHKLTNREKSCLFTEKALSEPHVELVAAGTGANQSELDSFGVSLTPGPGLYGQLMTKNFQTISDCVNATRPKVAENAEQRYLVPDERLFPAQIVPRYLMMDQFGRAVSSEDFRGKLQLIFFGYTFCPDICPTSLAVMAQALDMLGEEAKDIQPIFITVDPQRDTPKHLAEYVRYFHPQMLGLSASPQMTKRTAELFRARYEFVPSESGDPDRYSVDHTASLYLLGRNGEFITKFAHGLPAQEVAERLRSYLSE